MAGVLKDRSSCSSCKNLTVVFLRIEALKLVLCRSFYSKKYGMFTSVDVQGDLEFWNEIDLA